MVTKGFPTMDINIFYTCNWMIYYLMKIIKHYLIKIVIIACLLRNILICEMEISGWGRSRQTRSPGVIPVRGSWQTASTDWLIRLFIKTSGARNGSLTICSPPRFPLRHNTLGRKVIKIMKANIFERRLAAARDISTNSYQGKDDCLKPPTILI